MHIFRICRKQIDRLKHQKTSSTTSNYLHSLTTIVILLVTDNPRFTLPQSHSSVEEKDQTNRGGQMVKKLAHVERQYLQ